MIQLNAADYDVISNDENNDDDDDYNLVALSSTQLWKPENAKYFAYKLKLFL